MKISAIKLTFIIFFALVSLSFAQVANEKAKPTTPEDVVKESADAMNNNDWARYTSLMHPEALGVFRKTILPILEYMKNNNQEAQIAFLLDSANSYEEAAKIDSVSFFRKVLSKIMNLPQVGDLIKNTKLSIIGKVPEGDSVCHVVYRVIYGPDNAPVTKVAVASLKKYHGRWLELLSGDISNMVNALGRIVPR